MKNSYVYFHQINRDNHYFKKLFSLDTENKYSRRCEEYRIFFQSCRGKKHCLLKYYKWAGGSNNLPINVSRRIFNAEKAVDDERRFLADGKVKAQDSMELINYKQAELDVIIEIESKRIWLTDVDTLCFFLTIILRKK